MRKALLTILFSFIACVFLDKAYPVDISGNWLIEVDYPSYYRFNSQVITVWENGARETGNFPEYITLGEQQISIPVTQSADGTISGRIYKKGNFQLCQPEETMTVNGKISGDSVTFRRIYTLKFIDPDGYGSDEVTITEDFEGVVEENKISGTVKGSFYQYEVMYYEAEYDEGEYEPAFTTYSTITGEYTESFSITLAPKPLDTTITSGPSGTIEVCDVTFTWIGTGGDGGIAGYYYQLDAQPKTFTTDTGITFTNLDYGTHTFSVAASDKKGNVDKTPATRQFTIEKEVERPQRPEERGRPVNLDQSAGDPINSLTGNMYEIVPDLVIPGRGLNLEFTRAYNSREDEAGPFGYGWTHSYNLHLIEDTTAGLVKIKDEQGKGYLFAVTKDGTYLAQQGEYSTFAKNKTGFIWTKKDGKQYLFDLTGRLAQIKDRNNNAIAFSYDKQGRLITIIDSVKRQVGLDYDTQNRIIRITDPMARSFSYSYDSQNNLVGIVNPAGDRYSYEYDASHNISKKTDAKGNSVYFTYDTQDRCISSASENNGGYTKLTFDPANKQTIIEDSKGNKTVQYYNDELLITKTVNPQGGQVFSDWNEDFNLVSRTDENGNTTLMEYDSKGNLTKVTDAEGNITIFTYEPNFNLLKTSTDAQVNITTYDYDAKGNLLKVTDALGNLTFYKYDAYGQLTSSTNALGKVTSFIYDAQGNLSSIKDAMGNTTVYKYDTIANLIQTIDAKKNVTQFSYNQLNQPVQIVYSDNSLVTYAYDEVGNRISGTDGNSNTSSFTYDQEGRAKSITDGSGNTISYDYDTEGNLISVTDQNFNKTDFEYDGLNRLISQTDALGHKTVYQYDAAGNRISKTDAKGQVINYEYDALNRLKKVLYSDSAVTYTYDSLGRRISMTDKFGTTTYSYDKVGRLIKVDGPADKDAVEYTYDKTGNRLTMIDPDGKVTKYTYDALNRLVSITDPQNKTTTFTYDSLGNLTAQVYPNGTKATYVYDNLNRLLKLAQEKVTKPVAKYVDSSYAYDRAGRRIGINAVGENIDYTYDASGRLTGEKRVSNFFPYETTYEYDPAGNRIRMIKDGVEFIYSYNELNQIIQENIHSLNMDSVEVTVKGKVSDANGIKSVTVNGRNANLEGDNFICSGIVLTPGKNTITITAIDNAENPATKSVNVLFEPVAPMTIDYTYDENGNLIQRATQARVDNLSYDAENRLVGISSSIGEMNYKYDGEGRRVAVTAGSSTINYFYDGMSAILERDAQGKTVTNYLRNPYANGGIGGIVKGVSPQGAVPEFYYHYDAIGNVVGLTDSVGAGVDSYAYDAFGNVLSGVPSNNPYRFVTKAMDPSGFVYFGARYYDPRIGRFITPDPSGMIDGPNLYLYCRNNPVNWVDPWGWCGERTGWQQYLYESALPGPYGQPISEWGPQGPTSWGDPMKYTEQAGDAWMWAERVTFSTSVAATMAAGGGIIAEAAVANTAVITGFTKHGINQAITRGVGPAAILEALRNPMAVMQKVDELGRASYQYIGKTAVVILNKIGEMITVWKK